MDSFERVRAIIRETTGIPEELITPESTAAQLNIDSLDMTELLLNVEEEFDVIIEREEDISSVKDIMACLEMCVA
ncbi:MAG: phosphopantetheine-binding protein [Eubacteriales bacterium]|nr:phosphopantetheine-binding protein [Eubacteriales bacterium]